jgi:fido (protein-threonine AMPylation protein)
MFGFPETKTPDRIHRNVYADVFQQAGDEREGRSLFAQFYNSIPVRKQHLHFVAATFLKGFRHRAKIVFRRVTHALPPRLNGDA